jgi:hypothetical protein
MRRSVPHRLLAGKVAMPLERWKKRWRWWLLGSLLVAAVPPLVGAFFDGREPGSNKGGIHLWAFGFFFASNIVVIEDGARQK